jgi:hypothetical protein
MKQLPENVEPFDSVYHQTIIDVAKKLEIEIPEDLKDELIIYDRIREKNPTVHSLMTTFLNSYQKYATHYGGLLSAGNPSQADLNSLFQKKTTTEISKRAVFDTIQMTKRLL